MPRLSSQFTVWILLLWMQLSASNIAVAGFRSGHIYSLTNSNFTAGLNNWSQGSTSGANYFTSASAPQAHATAVTAQIPAGKQAWLWTTFSAPSAPTSSELGEKMEGGAWVYLPATATYDANGTIVLQLYSRQNSSDTLVAQSAALNLATAPRDQWIYLFTAPVGNYDARIQTGATQVKLQLHMNSRGQAYFDDVTVGKFEPREFSLINANFETALQTRQPMTLTMNGVAGWSALQGQVMLNNPLTERDAYYGAGYLKMTGSTTTVQQLVSVNGGADSPRLQRALEGGAWIYLENDTAFGGNDYVELSLWAHQAGQSTTNDIKVATRNFTPNFTDRGYWIYLHTDSTAALPLPFNKNQLRLTITKSFPGTIRLDYVQLGELYGIHGNPKKQVSANYVGVYRSPDYPGTYTNPTLPTNRWNNWYSHFTPACDANQTQFFHYPDSYRSNGRRDLGVSPYRSVDDLPLAGGYDSRDPQLIAWHIRLAQAMSIDRFNFDYYGHKLAQQNIAFGLEAVNEETLTGLLDAAEKPGVNFKISVMYEPKVAFAGWLQNQPNTLSGKKTMLKDDLTYLVSTYYQRKALLKVDGQLLVTLFDQRQCFDPGTGTVCIEDSDWAEIKQDVEQATGRKILLVGTSMPTSFNFKTGSWYPTSLGGMMQWKLLSLPFMQYKTYADAINQNVSFPAATNVDLQQFADKMNRLTNQWWQQNDTQRLQLAVVWPGFDDRGVAGWGASNLNGQNAQPLCLRVADEIAGNFQQVTFASALAADPDWIELATFNDWNERTNIEPRWDAVYYNNVLSGQAPNGATLMQVFEQALTTQGWIATFKGLPAIGAAPAGNDLHSVTRDYLLNPLATKYD